MKLHDAVSSLRRTLRKRGGTSSIDIDEALKGHGLRSLDVGAAGNCHFRALAHHLLGDAERHQEVRAAVVAEMRNHPERYQEFAEDWDPHVPESRHLSYASFLKRLARTGTWGGNASLRAAAIVYGRTIVVVQAGDAQPTQISPYTADGQGVMGEGGGEVWLAYMDGNHYRATEPLDATQGVPGDAVTNASPPHPGLPSLPAGPSSPPPPPRKGNSGRAGARKARTRTVPTLCIRGKKTKGGNKTVINFMGLLLPEVEGRRRTELALQSIETGSDQHKLLKLVADYSNTGVNVMRAFVIVWLELERSITEIRYGATYPVTDPDYAIKRLIATVAKGRVPQSLSNHSGALTDKTDIATVLELTYGIIKSLEEEDDDITTPSRTGEDFAKMAEHFGKPPTAKATPATSRTAAPSSKASPSKKRARSGSMSPGKGGKRARSCAGSVADAGDCDGDGNAPSKAPEPHPEPPPLGDLSSDTDTSPFKRELEQESLGASLPPVVPFDNSYSQAATVYHVASPPPSPGFLPLGPALYPGELVGDVLPGLRELSLEELSLGAGPARSTVYDETVAPGQGGTMGGLIGEGECDPEGLMTELMFFFDMDEHEVNELGECVVTRNPNNPDLSAARPRVGSEGGSPLTGVSFDDDDGLIVMTPSTSTLEGNFEPGLGLGSKYSHEEVLAFIENVDLKTLWD
mmetsp:Transcript_20420/g.42591  ORF Transcript_20420/g.42591 Transcript_20420/m.42591 type:complete len:689 (+) Transcript_20420:221-2287(+)